AVGGVRYSVLLDGRVVRHGLRKRAYRPRPAALGNGVRRVRVLATDALGGQVLTKALKLRVDGEAPIVKIEVKPGRRAVSISVLDADSGLKKKATLVRFGAG